MTVLGEPAPDATVLIATRDRRDRLRRALESATGQTVRVEVVVLDDGSRDGTEEMLRTDFPGVRVVRSEQAIGCPAQRNRGFELARAPIVICLDDDAWFSTPNVAAQALAQFDDPRIAVVAIPYVNVRREEPLRQHAPSADRWVTATFAGGASAFRRDDLRRVGGYVELGGHGEETDLALRLLDLGRLVALGRGDHIIHEDAEYPKPPRTYVLSARNHLLGTWRNVPWPYLAPRAAAVAAAGVIDGVRGRAVAASVGGIAQAAARCMSGRAERAPVRRETYVLFRRLARRGPLRLSDVVLPLREAA